MTYWTPTARSPISPIARFWSLAAILGVAFWLRCVEADLGWFGVDQARDLAWSDAIVDSGERPVVGPLMRGRVHLGATYYFFWSIPRWISDQPVAANWFAGVLGCLAVLTAYAVGARMAGPRCGLAAAALFATSPTAVIDGRVAWAPAAVPLACGAFLWAGVDLLRRPRARRAFLAMALAGSATQLHLSTAPWIGLASVAVASRRRALGVRGIVGALLGLVVALAPMVMAWRADVRIGGRAGGDRVVRVVMDADPRVTQEAGDGSANSGGEALAPAAAEPTPRLQLVARRVRALPGAFAAPLDGTTRASARSATVATLLAVEPVVAVLSLLAGLLLLVAPARLLAEASSARLIAGTAWLATLAVVLLPGEAWVYYLDAASLPFAICLAAVLFPSRAAAPSWRLVAAAVSLTALVALRVVGLASWRTGVAADGYFPVDLRLWNLDHRGAVVDGGAPARVATLRAKEDAARWIVERIGPDLSRWRGRVHGPGFADLDSDNGGLFRRAAARVAGAPVVEGQPSNEEHILVLTREDLRPEWSTEDLASSQADVGPWRLSSYTPRADAEGAWLEGCSTDDPAARADVPRWTPGDPRDYGHGEPVMPIWPCPEPTLVIPAAASSAPTGSGSRTLRVFVRPVGGVHVGSLTVEPASELVGEVAAVAGSGPGVQLRGERPALVRAALRVDGPGFADVWELTGATRP